ncbi:MAG: bifunctional SulP family inorganic anion transporter/carbonic anhydrase [Verrucomicrobia bacterium]|nr:bifunctional SulP family inorganic anion transporter/carbonic anhydrase [Verrucomicrobiota bacterium]
MNTAKELHYFKNLKHDVPSSIVVFLVAMPLCLGVALASGAPLFAGIISGIIGGVVVGSLSGSALGVSGPAAGLAVIVLTAIADLGEYEIFLVAVVLAGVIQLIMGYLRAGIIGYYFPSSVIHGMLAGIGIMIFLKQLPHAFGYDAVPEGDQSFFESDGYNTFSELFHMMEKVSPGPVVVTLVSMGILLFWDTAFMKKQAFTKLLPGPLLAVAAGIILNKVFGAALPNLVIAEEHLVSVPIPENMSEFFGNFSFPDFTALTNPQVYMTAIIIAVVASLETLLSLEAIDKLDPYKRISPTNRELKAQGVGNIVAGLIGGLPVTQVIVRSSANMQAGGRTKTATVLHGVWLLISVISIPALLNQIPLAVLAAILLLVGYKLAKPALFKKMYKQGLGQFMPFIVTIAAMLFSDLLTGIFLGMAVAIFVILKNNLNIPIRLLSGDLKGKRKVRIVLSEDVTFLNKASIQNSLLQIPNGSIVEIDGSNTFFMHNDIREIIEDFMINSKTREIEVTTIGLDDINQKNELQHFEIEWMSASTQEQQQKLTPEAAHQKLVEGNKRFAQNLKAHRNAKDQVLETSEAQYPFAAILSCIDSRVPVEMVFDQGIGDIFSVRVAGNIISTDILGSMEYACKVAGAKIIVVMGHTQCGAIGAACKGVEMGNITPLLGKIKPAIDIVRAERGSVGEGDCDEVSAENVKVSIGVIRKESPILAEMEKKGEIEIVGASYSVANGKVEFFDI